jgi:hypothetical protein
MSESADNASGGPPQPPPPANTGEQVWHAPVSARLPERVAPGVFCMGAIVLEGPEEFVIDFVQNLARPVRIGARIIMAPRVLGQFVQALEENLGRYQQAFGPPKELPRPPQADRRPTIQEIYDELKIPEELLSGVYATTVMIGHSPAEFFFDFITRFYPTAAVAARVYMSAPQVPRVLESISTALHRFRLRTQQQQPPPPAAAPPPPNQDEPDSEN